MLNPRKAALSVLDRLRWQLDPAEVPRSVRGTVMAGAPPCGVRSSASEYAHWVPEGGCRSHCGMPCEPASVAYLRTLQACPTCDQAERGFFHRAGEGA